MIDICSDLKRELPALSAKICEDTFQGIHSKQRFKPDGICYYTVRVQQSLLQTVRIGEDPNIRSRIYEPPPRLGQ